MALPAKLVALIGSGAVAASAAAYFAPFEVLREDGNSSGISVASLSATADGNGQLQLTNASGQTMVEAGVTIHGVGAVRTGPHGFNSNINFLGLPGSYIAGKK